MIEILLYIDQRHV